MFGLFIFLSLITVLIAAFVVFDKLVRLEYFSHRSNWLKDGKPHGFFWVPPESLMAGGWLVRFGSSVASQRKLIVWLFSTPDWMRRDERALRLVFWLRILVISWNVGIGGIIVVALLLQIDMQQILR
jgi:hypothetical protein